MDRDSPPALSDATRDQLDDAQALKGARAFLVAVRSKRPEIMIPRMALPYTQHLSGARPHTSAGEGCFDAQRYIDEHEGLPGAPQCLAVALAPHASALEAALSAEVVFPSLAALEAKSGKLRGPVRKLLRPLSHHRLLLLTLAHANGPLQLVLALRRHNGTLAVDAVSAELPPRKPSAAASSQASDPAR